jgi:hypothetical protein
VSSNSAEDAGSRSGSEEPGRRPSDVFVTLSEIVAFIVGLGAFVYIAGAAVLWVRLSRSHFPADSVVTSLPRELVVGIGLKSVVAPSVALAIVAGLGIVLVSVPARLRRYRSSSTKTTHGTIGVLLGITVGIAAALVFAFNYQLFVWWGVAAVLAYFIALGIGRSLQHESWDVPKVALAAAAIGLLGAAFRVVVEAVDPRLDNATVCVKDGGAPYVGLLIGEAANAVYLGREEEDDAGRSDVVVAIPRERVSEVWIGPEAEHECTPIPQSAGG